MDNYLSITKYCNIFNKKPSHFLDNERIISLSAQINKPPKITKGRCGDTQIPQELLPEFLLWLSKETRQMVLAGKSPKEILNYLDSN